MVAMIRSIQLPARMVVGTWFLGQANNSNLRRTRTVLENWRAGSEDYGAKAWTSQPNLRISRAPQAGTGQPRLWLLQREQKHHGVPPSRRLGLDPARPAVRRRTPGTAPSILPLQYFAGNRSTPGPLSTNRTTNTLQHPARAYDDDAAAYSYFGKSISFGTRLDVR